MNILEEAQALTAGARKESYGHPLDDGGRTAALWSAILGFPVEPEQVGLCMIAVKISRECNQHNRDNLVDLAGYARFVDMVYEERAKRQREADLPRQLHEVK